MAIWTCEQTAQFLNGIDEHRLYAAYHLIALRGLRRGEAAGLRWCDLDLESGTATINGQSQRISGELVACPPKTDTAVRSITLDKSTIAALRRHRVRQRAELARLETDGGGYVFTTERGAPMSPDTLTRTFNKLVARSGLPPIRLHDLRQAARWARREIGILGELPPNPYIVAVRDHGTERELLFLAMEWIDGRPLNSLRRPRLEQVQRWCEQICLGLRHCHRHRVFHRDIKPGNVMITTADDAKLVDSGIARTFRSSLTAPGYPVGSPPYMPPERWLGQRGDHLTDLYSLGCLMYELLTGEPPFGSWHGDDHEQLRYDHLNRAPVPPTAGFSGIPVAVDRLVLDLLAKAPEHRPQSADEVIERLREIVHPTANATVLDVGDRNDEGDDSMNLPAVLGRSASDVPHIDPGSLNDLQTADEAVRKARERYGDDNLMTLEARAELAEQIGRSGDRDGALRAYDELIPDYQRVCGQHDPRTQQVVTFRMMWMLGNVPPRPS